MIVAPFDVRLMVVTPQRLVEHLRWCQFRRRRFDVLPCPAQSSEHGVGSQRQRAVPVPAVPTPHLVVIEPNLAPGLLNADLHLRALAGDPRQGRGFGRVTVGGAPGPGPILSNSPGLRSRPTRPAMPCEAASPALRLVVSRPDLAFDMLSLPHVK